MEHWMDRSRLRQVQVVCNLPNLFEDTKGAEELEGQLVVGTSSDRGLDIRLKLKKDPITNIEGALSAMLVSLPFHTVLSAMKVLLNQALHEVSVSQPLLEFRNWSGNRKIQAQQPWWKAI